MASRLLSSWSLRGRSSPAVHRRGDVGPHLARFVDVDRTIGDDGLGLGEQFPHARLVDLEAMPTDDGNHAGQRGIVVARPRIAEMLIRGGGCIRCRRWHTRGRPAGWPSARRVWRSRLARHGPAACLPGPRLTRGVFVILARCPDRMPGSVETLFHGHVDLGAGPSCGPRLPSSAPGWGKCHRRGGVAQLVGPPNSQAALRP